MGQPSKASERHLLHFDATSSLQRDHTLTYYAGLTPHRIHAHTKATRSDARVGNPLLQRMPDTRLSHYLEVDLPTDSVMVTYLARATEVEGAPTEDFLSLAVHVPREGRQRLYENRLLRGVSQEQHPKLAWLLEDDEVRQELSPLLHSDAALLETELLHDLIDPFETASTLLFQHPSLINLNTEHGGAIPALILRDCVGRALRKRSRLLDEIRRLGEQWSRRVPMLDADGKVVTDAEGTIFTIEVHEGVRRHMGAPMGLALKYSQQMEELQGQTWRMQYGQTVEEHRPARAKQQGKRPLLQADQTRWTLKALSTMNGVSTGAVSFDPPREGGLEINEGWSSSDPTPMSKDIVDALIEGRMFVRVETADDANAWKGGFAAQPPKQERETVFEAAYRSGSAGADAFTVDLRLDDLQVDLYLHVRMHSTSNKVLRTAHLYVREPNGVERSVWSAAPTTKGKYGQLRVDMKNEWLRHLVAYAEFFDASGRVIKPENFPGNMPSSLSPYFDHHDTKRYIDLIDPVTTIFGVPIPADTQTLKIDVPESASSVKLYWGGLGTGEFDATVCLLGILCTAVIEMALPIYLLVKGASEKNTGIIHNLMKDPKVRMGIYSLGIGVTTGYAFGASQDPGKTIGRVATVVLPKLAKLEAKKFSLYLAQKAGEAVAKRAVPLINLAFLALDTTITLMQLAQTTAAVLQSPFYYTTELTRTFDLRGRVLPDPAFNKFPDHHDRMVVRVLYDSGNTLPVQEIRLPGETLSKPLPFEFNGIAAGGRVKVMVFFYAANGWQSAMGASGWVDAKGAQGSSVLALDVVVKNALIPLSRQSVYEHRQSIVFEGGRHRWKQRPAPTTTITTAPTDDGHRLLSMGGITVAQRPGMLGYSWQANGLNRPRDRPGPPTDGAMHTMQNLSLLEDPEASYASSPLGFSLPCGVAYDLGSAEDGSGASFYLDPSGGDYDDIRNPAGGYHLRRIALSLHEKPLFEPGKRESWGRFSAPVDRFVVHPQGYAAGVSADTSKLYLLKLAAPKKNEEATVASPYSGEGERVGLLLQPCAIAVALDGRLLVLEQGNNRIQSFDISGNPVPYFKPKGQTEKSAVLPLRQVGAMGTTYLDLSVEAKGYLFVLAYDGNGSQPEHYRIDIYEPDGSFLVSTPRVAAARIAVDLARSLYTLNWETLSGPDRRTEPSLSMWLPPPPPPMSSKRKK
ncbi:hypothetical protein DVJ77_07100 [Dyella tabacisoli]|uniref:Uncharacterized protein n=2 Tax=Dyella tabacisoli TaxID=2282381 RepID=A0A369UR27_9GAMM|nr:hypothetical protein DVJ77_07100 [Dyella tabacisoli]